MGPVAVWEIDRCLFGAIDKGSFSPDQLSQHLQTTFGDRLTSVELTTIITTYTADDLPDDEINRRDLIRTKLGFARMVQEHRPRLTHVVRFSLQPGAPLSLIEIALRKLFDRVNRHYVGRDYKNHPEQCMRAIGFVHGTDPGNRHLHLILRPPEPAFADLDEFDRCLGSWWEPDWKPPGATTDFARMKEWVRLKFRRKPVAAKGSTHLQRIRNHKRLVKYVAKKLVRRLKVADDVLFFGDIRPSRNAPKERPVEEIIARQKLARLSARLEQQRERQAALSE